MCLLVPAEAGKGSPGGGGTRRSPASCLDHVAGDLEKVSELISGLAPEPEEESPYEALFEATSCHSLDSLTSGKSSDRDSGRPESEAGKVSSSPPSPSYAHTWQKMVSLQSFR